MIPHAERFGMGGEVIGPRLVAQWGRAMARRVVVAVERFAFWTAIGLPFLYGTGLILYGNELIRSKALLGLVSLNLVALVVGHRHRHPDRHAGSGGERSSSGSSGSGGSGGFGGSSGSGGSGGSCDREASCDHGVSGDYGEG